MQSWLLKKCVSSDVSVQRCTKTTTDNCFLCYKAKLSLRLHWLHCFLLYNCALCHRILRSSISNQLPVILLPKLVWSRQILHLPVCWTEIRRICYLHLVFSLKWHQPRGAHVIADTLLGKHSVISRNIKTGGGEADELAYPFWFHCILSWLIFNFSYNFGWFLWVGLRVFHLSWWDN